MLLQSSKSWCHYFITAIISLWFLIFTYNNHVSLSYHINLPNVHQHHSHCSQYRCSRYTPSWTGHHGDSSNICRAANRWHHSNHRSGLGIVSSQTINTTWALSFSSHQLNSKSHVLPHRMSSSSTETDSAPWWTWWGTRWPRASWLTSAGRISWKRVMGWVLIFKRKSKTSDRITNRPDLLTYIRRYQKLLQSMVDLPVHNRFNLLELKTFDIRVCLSMNVKALDCPSKRYLR